MKLVDNLSKKIREAYENPKKYLINNPYEYPQEYYFCVYEMEMIDLDCAKGSIHSHAHRRVREKLLQINAENIERFCEGKPLMGAYKNTRSLWNYLSNELTAYHSGVRKERAIAYVNGMREMQAKVYNPIMQIQEAVKPLNDLLQAEQLFVTANTKMPHALKEVNKLIKEIR